MSEQSDISYFARTNGRLPHRTFGIRQADRLHHMYVIGRTGTGKSTLLMNLAHGDLLAGRGFVFIDPHGDAAAALSARAAASKREDVQYWNVADPETPYGYNPLRRVEPSLIPLAASGLMAAMKKQWGDAWGVRMEHMLRNALYALLEYGEATLPDVLTIFVDRRFRADVLRAVSNPQVQTFWTEEYPKLNPMFRRDAIAPIQNKIGAFLADPRLYRILTEPPLDLSFRRIMDSQSVLIVNLAKGVLGEDSAGLLGALLVTTLGVAAESRATVPEAERRPSIIYIDEFQAFTTLSVANMVSELRKYQVGLVLAHQHLNQLEPDVRHAVLANVGTLVSFRLGPEDATIIARELAPAFAPTDLVHLPTYDIALSLMIDGSVSRPFSATTLPSIWLDK